jgi:hypothetical protein
MLDALTEHLNPGMFVIALIGHVIAESTAKFTLNGVRYLGYLAALALLPVLLRTVDQRRTANSDARRPRKAR